jgi:hypothetical protein
MEGVLKQHSIVRKVNDEYSIVKLCNEKLELLAVSTQ